MAYIRYCSTREAKTLVKFGISIFAELDENLETKRYFVYEEGSQKRPPNKRAFKRRMPRGALLKLTGEKPLFVDTRSVIARSFIIARDCLAQKKYTKGITRKDLIIHLVEHGVDEGSASSCVSQLVYARRVLEVVAE